MKNKSWKLASKIETGEKTDLVFRFAGHTIIVESESSTCRWIRYSLNGTDWQLWPDKWLCIQSAARHNNLPVA